jgi:ferrochelatase
MSTNDSSTTNKQKIGVLMVNLGSPDEPTPSAVRRYLKQFLSDPRVVQLNRLLWWLILNLVILNIRPKRVAEAYRSVWTDEGSPLVSTSKKQAAAVAEKLNKQYGDSVVTELAMTYGNPSVTDALERLRDAGAEKILVLPMYPQFSYTTTAAVTDAVDSALKTLAFSPDLIVVNDYHDHPAYIDAIADSIRQQWVSADRAQLLVFSYHGIPQSYVDKGDPYYEQCCETTRLITRDLNLDENDSRLVFQSRFGREPWLQPYCDKTMTALPGEGITSIDILCPGFSADCLETLEEIQKENKGYFLGAKGKTFNYIACLNDSDEHIDALVTIINQHISHWVND